MPSALQTVAARSIDVEVHDLDALPDARLDDWLALFAALPDAGFHHHPDWFAAIDAHLLPGTVRVACARDADGPLALLPLTGAPTAREALHPRHAHLARADILLHPRLAGADARDLVGRLLYAAAPRAEVWRIADLPDDAALARTAGVPAQTPPAGWCYRPSRPSASFLLNDAQAPVPGKLRRNLARLRRRLEASGELRVERARGADDLPRAWQRFLAVEASGWKGDEEAGTAIANDPRLAAFYGALLVPTAAGLTAVIDLLTLDGECIAGQFGLECNGVQSLLKIGYDERHAAAAPGSLLLDAVLERAAAEGLQRLSLVTSPPWAARWHPLEQSLWHVVRYADTAGGRRRRMLDDVKGFARDRFRR